MRAKRPADAPGCHHLEVAEISSLLGVDVGEGLSKDEVARRQMEYGPNRPTARDGTPAWRRFLLQFHQPLVYILMVAGGTTAVLGEWVDSGVIFGVVVINAIIGFLQESKAEKAIMALNSLLLTEATVRRAGRRQRVPSVELVPGDVVLLQGGDRVPADLRIIESNNLEVDESALTGESLPVAKCPGVLAGEVVLADRKNQAFAGTLVTRGMAEGLVWAIGDQTETGRIAWLIAGAVEVSTPLTRKIAVFSRFLLWVILGLAAATFTIGVARGEAPVEMFMAAVALAVGAIPEGLPAAVTIVLAIGVSRMAKSRAIIRKLPAVETLGSTTVICSDKTGTLTENQMTVQQVFAGGEAFDVSGTGYEPGGGFSLDGKTVDPLEHPALMECLRAGVLCNDSQLVVEDGRHLMHGDPTEAALLVAGAKAGLIHAEILAAHPCVGMIPFESAHMFRATLHETRHGRTIYKVGAVEKLLPRCADALGPDGLTCSIDLDVIHAAVDTMAGQGLRVLAFARRHTGGEHQHLAHEHVRHGLTFLGLQGMIDPPRREAMAAVARCRRAGILVKMITGDHAVTAKVIAGKIGITGEDGSAPETMTGQELEQVSDAALPELAHRVPVFARVAPEQKLRLVEALQARGHIVAMTGDGVNDAPALKQADIGVAMGISGTDVAKGAADMVLLDDNFATIEAAVEEGRGVFENLRKFIVWTLPTNIGEGCIILAAIGLGITLPVLPVHVLWVNMATAILLGLMLVFEPKEEDLMDRAPRDPSRPLLTWPLFMRTALVSLFIIGGGIGLFFHQLQEGRSLAEARTAVVNLIVMVEVAYLFSCRSLEHSLLAVGIFSNRPAISGVLIMLAAQGLFTYWPVMNRLFHTTPIDLAAWWRILAVAVVSFLAVELEKWIRFGRTSRLRKGA